MSANLPRSTLPLTSRRTVLAGLGLAAASVTFAEWPVFAERKDGPAEVPVDELMKSGAGDLPDLVLGPADAKVTVVEYASMTCGHCAAFATKVFPELKTKYIDSGKIRFVMREFPLDNLAAAVSMLTRCAGGDKTIPLIETFYQTQSDWAFKQGNPVPRLFEIAKQAGFTQATFDECLKDQKLYEAILAMRERGSKDYKVESTPTLFINGKVQKGGASIEELDKLIQPFLKS